MILNRIASLTLLSALSAGLYAKAPEPLPTTITVRLYNLAEAPADELAIATQEAAEIFARVGVTLEWLDCSAPSPEPRCSAVRGPRVLNLRLMPPSMQPKGGLPAGIFGFALMSTKGGFAQTANVWFERVSAISDGRQFRRPVVLGAILAHELGHLILGINSHSKKGLMTLPWDRDVLTAANRGMLSFSKREASRVHAGAQARAAVQP